MKSLLAIFTACCVSFALAGCGGGEKAPAPAPTTPAPTEHPEGHEHPAGGTEGGEKATTPEGGEKAATPEAGEKPATPEGAAEAPAKQE